MSNQRNKLIALALAGACGFGVYKAGQALFMDEAQGAKHAVNQVWIDHMPSDDRDMVTHLALIDHPRGKIGAAGRSSQWRHMVDIMKWKLNGDRLQVFFPQERARGQVTLRTWECSGEAPAPFDLCLELTGQSGESFTLYSRKEWKIEPRDVDDSLEDIADETPALAGVLHVLGEDQAEQLADIGVNMDAAESWTLRALF